MKVRELIEELQKYHPELQVSVSTYRCDIADKVEINYHSTNVLNDILTVEISGRDCSSPDAYDFEKILQFQKEITKEFEKIKDDPLVLKHIEKSGIKLQRWYEEDESQRAY